MNTSFIIRLQKDAEARKWEVWYLNLSIIGVVRKRKVFNTHRKVHNQIFNSSVYLNLPEDY